MWFKVLIIALVLYVLPSHGDVIDLCKTHDKIVAAGYPAERYDVETEDGYILEVNRIPRGKESSDAIRPVVFLMHGLTGCSNNYVHLGPEKAIAYNLVDAGYDVWIGNARGVSMSRRHRTLNPDDNEEKKEFFDYSWEDIALYDLPAMIDFALAKSGQEQLHYIGHSQGGTVFLVLNSMKTEYNKKFISAHLLAGVGYQQYFPHTILKAAAKLTSTIQALAHMRGIYEVFGQGWNFNHASISKSACASGECTKTPEVEDVVEEASLTTDLLAGSALKQFAHYGQNIADKKFRRWYYSPMTNLLKYGSLEPPKYDLSKIDVDVTMHYTVGDELLDERDVLDMVNDLPRAKARKVAKEEFTHVDFVVSPDLKTLVTDYILDDLKQR